MRRYWHPIAPAALLEAKSVQSVRLLGEDLDALNRDPLRVRLGLIGQRCPQSSRRHATRHSRTKRVYVAPITAGSLTKNRRVHRNAVRTPHLNFKSKVAIEAYPVQELGGLIWAYLGPLPVPLLPQDDLSCEKTASVRSSDTACRATGFR